MGQINELRLIEQRRSFDPPWLDWPSVLTEEAVEEAASLFQEEEEQEEQEEEEQEQQRRRQQERANRIHLLSNHMSTEQAERLLERNLIRLLNLMVKKLMYKVVHNLS